MHESHVSIWYDHYHIHVIEFESLHRHCFVAGLGLHSPGNVSFPVSIQVLVLDPESIIPSSHWKVATPPSVVLDTLTVPLEGGSGSPQSTTVHNEKH